MSVMQSSKKLSYSLHVLANREHCVFINEMKRFLRPKVIADTVGKDEFWTYLCLLIREEASLIV
jgi:hypothetical protein